LASEPENELLPELKNRAFNCPVGLREAFAMEDVTGIPFKKVSIDPELYLKEMCCKLDELNPGMVLL
jgi:hypothetical protein